MAENPSDGGARTSPLYVRLGVRTRSPMCHVPRARMLRSIFCPPKFVAVVLLGWQIAASSLAHVLHCDTPQVKLAEKLVFGLSWAVEHVVGQLFLRYKPMGRFHIIGTNDSDSGGGFNALEGICTAHTLNAAEAQAELGRHFISVATGAMSQVGPCARRSTVSSLAPQAHSATAQHKMRTYATSLARDAAEARRAYIHEQARILPSVSTLGFFGDSVPDHLRGLVTGRQCDIQVRTIKQWFDTHTKICVTVRGIPSLAFHPRLGVTVCTPNGQQVQLPELESGPKYGDAQQEHAIVDFEFDWKHEYGPVSASSVVFELRTSFCLNSWTQQLKGPNVDVRPVTAHCCVHDPYVVCVDCFSRSVLATCTFPPRVHQRCSKSRFTERRLPTHSSVPEIREGERCRNHCA